MALSIKNPEVDRLARDLTEITGETLTDVVRNALKERLERVRNTHGGGNRQLQDELMDIGRSCARLPVLDPRSADEILGYGPDGLPS